MKKNVLIFGHGYKHGFIEATNQYIQLFDKDRYHVTVIYLDGEESTTVTEQHLSADIIYFNTSHKDKKGLKWKSIKHLLALHKKHNFQIVICHRYKPAYIMLWVNLFKKIPHVVCVFHELNALQSLGRKLLFKLVAKSNTMVAGVSNALRDNLQKHLPNRNVLTYYNTIDIENTEKKLLTRAIARKLLNVTEETFLFGTLGRLVPAKDHATMIKAFSLLKPNAVKAKLLIIGEGELKHELQHLIDKLNMTNDILLTGYLPDAFSLLTAFDTFVLSSQKEAFGRVLLEAMIAKCPIIATETDGIPEVVGDIGRLIPKNNPEKLAEAMRDFLELSFEALEQQSHLSYARARDAFSWEVFRKKFWTSLSNAQHPSMNPQ